MRVDYDDARAAVRAFLSIGDVTTVDAYIRAGGDVNAVLGEGWTALHSAASHGQVRVLERLINDASCDLNTVSAYVQCKHPFS
jgi:ankyrin repeat protein